MKRRWITFLEWLRPAVRVLAAWLGLYLDDLCLVGAGFCFIRAADSLFGRDGALVTAGACLVLYAIVVAKSRGGDGR